MSVYDFNARTIDGKDVSLSDYKGKVLLIVNTASKCGFTPQYYELQKLYQAYADKGLVVLGFPSNQFAEQEPGSNEEVQQFCQINYGVQFPLFEKTEVRGNKAHPLFNYLTQKAPFQGFNPDHPIGGKLQAILQEKFPELLEGDSIKWNFTKFLVNREGEVVGRYEPTTTPLEMKAAIEALL
ncbi:redoxin domain-containing protein [Heliobacterium gestii]|uniref:Glutathione peroxidase n=1 Tax=Heliomicrobium gestii TaxID=2699 RepID=A0A845LBM2_HELGE|nr:glutathione peroxidase [Heliomicrobium gestii]MBM7865665.1 glutathione peroxidase [Heliomicrobium gestii]MZP41915.1 redoxin domain-containing protein [Heliomicrobium gestii]